MANHAVFVSHTPSFIDSYQSFYRLSKKGAEMTHKTIIHLVAQHPLGQKDYEKFFRKEKNTLNFYRDGMDASC